MKNANNTKSSFSLSEDCETYTFVPQGATTLVVRFGDGEEMGRDSMPVQKARDLYRTLLQAGWTKGY
jgi:hypothetical protein